MEDEKIRYIYGKKNNTNVKPFSEYKGQIVKLCPFINKNCYQSRCAMWRWTNEGELGYCALAGKFDTL